MRPTKKATAPLHFTRLHTGVGQPITGDKTAPFDPDFPLPGEREPDLFQPTIPMAALTVLIKMAQGNGELNNVQCTRFESIHYTSLF